ENVYLDESYLQPDEETNLISDNELLLYSDEQDLYLLLDDNLSLNNKSSLENKNSVNNIPSLNKESSNIFA
ncbi:15716_t:CDS:1, partial [Racocetra persica]